MKMSLKKAFATATLATIALVGVSGCASEFERKMNYELDKTQGEFEKCRAKDNFLRRSGKSESGLSPDDKCHAIFYGPWSKKNSDEQTSGAGYTSPQMPGL